MHIIQLTEPIPQLAPQIATIGMFDGVHRGHRFLLDQVNQTAHERGFQSMVITFHQHPRQVLHSDFQPQMLSTLDEKLALLAQTNVDNCVVLHFTPEMAAMSARDFMQTILHDQLNVKTLFTGYDNRFGHDRTEGFDDYVRYGTQMDMEVRQSEAFSLAGVNVSSSVIRAFLQDGEIEMANRCLGYPYTLQGIVINGEHIGTGIGFPTANLQSRDSCKLVPADGVYAVTAHLGGHDEPMAGMTNIGTRPTFDGTHQSIETHLLDFQSDIYDKSLAISFIRRLRTEHKFHNRAELIAQLRRDKMEVQQIFNQKI